jgi:hypothetical protein
MGRRGFCIAIRRPVTISICCLVAVSIHRIRVRVAICVMPTSRVAIIDVGLASKSGAVKGRVPSCHLLFCLAAFVVTVLVLGSHCWNEVHEEGENVESVYE